VTSSEAYENLINGYFEESVMHRKGSKSPNRGANGSGMSGSKHIRHKSANPAAMRSSSQNERIQQIDDLCNMDLGNMVINGAAIG